MNCMINFNTKVEQAALQLSLREPIFTSNLSVKGGIERSVAVLSKTRGTKQAGEQIPT